MLGRIVGMENTPNSPPPPQDPRRRLKELLAVPENQRTDAQWDEIVELEIQTAPGNRITPAQGQQPRSNQAPFAGHGRRDKRPPKKNKGGQGGHQGGQGGQGGGQQGGQGGGQGGPR